MISILLSIRALRCLVIEVINDWRLMTYAVINLTKLIIN